MTQWMLRAGGHSVRRACSWGPRPRSKPRRYRRFLTPGTLPRRARPRRLVGARVSAPRWARDDKRPTAPREHPLGALIARANLSARFPGLVWNEDARPTARRFYL